MRNASFLFTFIWTLTLLCAASSARAQTVAAGSGTVQPSASSAQATARSGQASRATRPLDAGNGEAAGIPASSCGGTRPCAPRLALTAGLALGAGDSRGRLALVSTLGASVRVYGPLSLTLRGSHEARNEGGWFSPDPSTSTEAWRVAAGVSYTLVPSGWLVARAGVIAGHATIRWTDGWHPLGESDPPREQTYTEIRGTAGLGVTSYVGLASFSFFVDGEVGRDQATVLFGVEVGAAFR